MRISIVRPAVITSCKVTAAKQAECASRALTLSCRRRTTRRRIPNARKLAELLYLNKLNQVRHGEHGVGVLKVPCDILLAFHNAASEACVQQHIGTPYGCTRPGHTNALTAT